MSEIDDAAVEVALTAFFKAGGGIPGMRAALVAYEELREFRTNAELEKAWRSKPLAGGEG